MEPFIAHVHIARAIQGDRSRPHKQAISGLSLGISSPHASAKFGDVILSHSTDRHAFAVRAGLVGTAEHIEPIVFTTGNPHRGAKSRTGELGPANGMAVLKLYGMYLRRHIHLTQHGYMGRPPPCQAPRRRRHGHYGYEMKSSCSKWPPTMGGASRPNQRSSKVA